MCWCPWIFCLEICACAVEGLKCESCGYDLEGMVSFVLQGEWQMPTLMFDFCLCNKNTYNQNQTTKFTICIDKMNIESINFSTNLWIICSKRHHSWFLILNSIPIFLYHLHCHNNEFQKTWYQFYWYFNCDQFQCAFDFYKLMFIYNTYF